MQPFSGLQVWSCPAPSTHIWSVRVKDVFVTLPGSRKRDVAALTWEAALAIRRVGIAQQVLIEGDRVRDAGLIDVKHASLPRALPGDGDEAVEGRGAEGFVEHLPAA